MKGDFDSKQLSRAMRYAIERQSLLRSLDMSRQQQLKFKDEFLSHVSHELRTPLTSIHQFATLLLDGLAGELNPEQREHLATIYRSANQLRTMIGDLLEATRAEGGKMTVEPRCVRSSEHGARIVAERIQERLELCRQLKPSCAFRVSSLGLQLPTDRIGKSLEKLVQEVADDITRRLAQGLQPIHISGEQPEIDKSERGAKHNKRGQNE